MTTKVLTDYQWKNLGIEKGSSSSWIRKIYERSFLYDLWSLMTAPTDVHDEYIPRDYGSRELISDTKHHPKINLGF